VRIYPPLNQVSTIGRTTQLKTKEPQVQAELFRLLVNDGFDVLAGVPIRQIARGLGVQFDLTVFKNRAAQAIIEIKSEVRGPTEDLDATMQGLKYRSFGIPVILFWDIKEYSELKKFLISQVIPEQQSPKMQTVNRDCLQRLYKSLDIASMSAYDVGMHELEAELERHRDFVKERLK